MGFPILFAEESTAPLFPTINVDDNEELAEYLSDNDLADELRELDLLEYDPAADGEAQNSIEDRGAIVSDDEDRGAFGGAGKGADDQSSIDNDGTDAEATAFDAAMFSFEGPRVPLTPTGVRSTFRAFASDRLFNASPAPSSFRAPLLLSTSPLDPLLPSSIMGRSRSSSSSSGDDGGGSQHNQHPNHRPLEAIDASPTTLGSVVSLESSSSMASFITVSTGGSSDEYATESFGFGQEEMYLDEDAADDYDDDTFEEDDDVLAAIVAPTSSLEASTAQQLPAITLTLSKNNGVFSKISLSNNSSSLSSSYSSSAVAPKSLGITAAPPSSLSTTRNNQSDDEKAQQRGEDQQPQQPQQPQQLRRGLASGGNCGCRKTHCLKLYCECFSSGNTCVDSCGCNDCWNQPSDKGSERRRAAVARCLMHKSRTFRPKSHIFRAEGMELKDARLLAEEEAMQTGGTAPGGAPRCFCKKSKCIKKYCDCFSAGFKCDSTRCKCLNCENLGGAAPPPQEQQPQARQPQSPPQQQPSSLAPVSAKKDAPALAAVAASTATVTTVEVAAPPPVVHKVAPSPLSPLLPKPSRPKKSSRAKRTNPATTITTGASLPPPSFASPTPQTGEGEAPTAKATAAPTTTKLSAISRTKRSGPATTMTPSGAATFGPTAPVMPRANKKPLSFDLRLRGRRGSSLGLSDDQRFEL